MKKRNRLILTKSDEITPDFDYSFLNPGTGKWMEKHVEFYFSVLRAIQFPSHHQQSTYIFGGGVNSGKTYLILYIIARLSCFYPHLKSHVIRKSYSNLEHTTIPSAQKLWRKNVTWHERSGNIYAEFHNQARVYFMSENYNADKAGDKFLGLETNIFFLEQIEELQHQTYQLAQQRAGRWKIQNKIMPRPLIFATVNPTTKKWVRLLCDKEKSKEKNLKPNVYFMGATIDDNPFATEYEKEMLSNMESRYYRTYVEGDWDVFVNDNRFFYNFSREHHIAQVAQREDEDVYFSFDFNVNPMTCLAAHIDIEEKKIEIFHEFRLENSNISELIQEIKNTDILKQANYIYVTGDATGNNRSALTDMTYYTQIEKDLNLTKKSINVPRKNLNHKTSNHICNYFLERCVVKIDENCQHLIDDIVNVEMKDDMSIEKKDKNLTHLSDCFRYLIHTYFENIVAKI